jgi:beta-lactamase class A
MIKITYTAILLFLSVSFHSIAQTGSLRQKITQVIAFQKASVGVSLYGIEDKDTLTINNQLHYPLQSVFKFHIALAVLHEVDKGALKLTQEIFIKKAELLPDTWSPIRDAYPGGDVKLPLAEIIKYTVAQSDNNGCDILLRLIGGTKKVDTYIRTTGITDFAIKVNEEDMHKAWDIQFANWTRAKSTTDLLILFYHQKLLSRNSFDFLWKTMIETSTGKDRIKGQLPAGTPVAHKTGTSGTNKQGITSAINDIGIVTLPNGKHFAISVFVSNSKENTATNEMIIADITKLAWDYFVSKSPLP